MEKDLKSAVKAFKALSDPTRLRILRLLTRGELCVCEITSSLGLEQSRVSHQMRILKEAGLVEDAREGRWIIYRIPGSAAAFLQSALGNPIGNGLGQWPESAEDLGRLQACLKEGLRFRIGCAPEEGRTQRSQGNSPGRA